MKKPLRDRTNWRLKARITQVFGTQSVFSAETGLREATISRIVRGFDHLEKSKREKWAECLRCEVSDIFPEEESLITKKKRGRGEL